MGGFLGPPAVEWRAVASGTTENQDILGCLSPLLAAFHGWGAGVCAGQDGGCKLAVLLSQPSVVTLIAGRGLKAGERKHVRRIPYCLPVL
jgi:hypothetical protein